MSEIFRDRPVKATDEVSYWVDYVLRYRGARHLRTVGADMIWLEYFNVDTALVFFLIGLVLFVLFLVALYVLAMNTTSQSDSREVVKKNK